VSVCVCVFVWVCVGVTHRVRRSYPSSSYPSSSSSYPSSSSSRRLMQSVKEWLQRMREQLLVHVRVLIMHGAPCTMSGGAFEEPLTAESLFTHERSHTHTHTHAHAQSARDLWAHYKCSAVLADIAHESLRSRSQGVCDTWVESAWERCSHRCSLQNAFKQYERRNRILCAVGARVLYRGLLRVHLVDGWDLVPVDQLSLTNMISGNDSCQPSTYLVIHFQGSCDASHPDVAPKVYPCRERNLCLCLSLSLRLSAGV
jgi:hypothetical protein